VRFFILVFTTFLLSSCFYLHEPRPTSSYCRVVHNRLLQSAHRQSYDAHRRLLPTQRAVLLQDYHRAGCDGSLGLEN
jgi:hypothetical protein